LPISHFRPQTIFDDKAGDAGWDMEILKLELADLSLPELDIDLGLSMIARTCSSS